MNLLIAFNTILQNEESSRQEEEVQDAGWENLEVVGPEESSDEGHEDFE
jgi:NADH pyrophosphatase NudC (nudix superfamily)